MALIAPAIALVSSGGGLSTPVVTGILAEVDGVLGMDAVEAVAEEYDRTAAGVLLCVAHRMHSEEGGDPEGSVSNDGENGPRERALDNRTS